MLNNSSTIIANIDWLRIGVVATAYCLGIFYYGGGTEIFLYLTSMLLLGFSLFQLFRMFAGVKYVWSTVHPFALVYVLLLIVNIYTSQFAQNTILISWQLLALPMVLLVLGQVDTQKWFGLVRLLGLIGIFSAVWGISEFATQAGRASGPVIDPNSWVSGLNILYFVLLSVYLSHSSRLSLLVLSAATVVSIAIFSGYSRVGNLVFFAALLFVVGIAFFTASLRRKAIIILISALLSLLLVTSIRSAEQATSNVEGYTLDVEAHGWTQRFAQWESGMAQYRDYPLFGSGLGTFKILYPIYRNTGDMNTAGNYLHNDYLQLLAEGGPVLLLLVLGLVLYLFVRLVGHLRQYFRQRVAAQLEPIILIVAIGTALVHALMNFTLFSLPNQILMAVCLARLLYLTGALRVVTLELSSPGLAKFGAAMVACYVLAVNSLDFINNDLIFNGGIIPVQADASGSDLERYNIVNKITQLRPQVASNRLAMARFYQRSYGLVGTDKAQSRSLAIVSALEYQRALELNPYHNQAREFFADLLLQNPWLMEEAEIYQTPEQLLRDGLLLNPCYLRSYLNLAKLLRHRGAAEEAYQLLAEKASRWVPLKYDDHEVFRLEYFQTLYQEARLRNDLPVLAGMLVLLN